MKTFQTIKEHAYVIGMVIMLLGVLAFTGCMVAALLLWTPGTPSATAQALVAIAACGLPVSILGTVIATLD